VKRIIVLVIELIVCFLLQTTVFQWFSLAHVVPNLLLILTVSSGFMRGRNEGLIVGFLSGLLIDFSYGSIIGLYALIFMFIGYINGFSHKIFVKDDLTIPIVLVGVSEFIYFFLYYVFNFLLRGKLNIFYYLIRIGIPEIVYTVVISILLYKILNIINLKLDRVEEEEA
jgi:rod shape-determining protein MreD